MEEYRLLSKKLKKNKPDKSYRNIVFSALNRVLVCIVLFLIGLIVTKNKTYKDYIYKYVYSYNLSFSEVENIYKKYFGNLIPEVKKKTSTEFVSSEKFTYNSLEETEGGVRLNVSKSAPISALESGLVIFVGEKEGYGKTLVLEQVDGVEAWYVGIGVTDLEIYDYVEKGAIIAASRDEVISLYFKKKGESVDYKNYLF